VHGIRATSVIVARSASCARGTRRLCPLTDIVKPGTSSHFAFRIKWGYFMGTRLTRKTIRIFAMVVTLGAAVSLSVAASDPAPAFADPVITPVSSYALDVPSSVLAAATDGVTSGTDTSGQLAAVLANSDHFDSDWLTTSVGQTMGGSTTVAPPDPSTLSPSELAQLEELESQFDGAPAEVLGGVSKGAVGLFGSAGSAASAVLLGVQLGAGADEFAGIDVQGELCAQPDDATNSGFDIGTYTDSFLRVLTSTDCTSWAKSAALADAANADAPVTWSLSNVCTSDGTICVDIDGVGFLNHASYQHDSWCVEDTGTTSAVSSAANDYTSTTVNFWLNDQSGASNERQSNLESIANGQSWGWLVAGDCATEGYFLEGGNTDTQTPAPPITSAQMNTSGAAVVQSVSFPTDPTRKFECTVTNTDSTTEFADSPTFTENDPSIPPPVSPAIPSDKVPASETCVELGGPLPITVSESSTTSAYQAWKVAYPACGNGSCLVDLRQNGVSCFFQNINCDGWTTNTDTGTDYECYIGTQVAALSECNVYGTTFNAADRSSGHAYADPSTGDITEGQTSASDIDLITSNLLSRTTTVSANYNSILDYTQAVRDVAEECADEVGIAPTGTQQYDNIPIVPITLEDCEDLAIYSPGQDVPEAEQHDFDAIGAGQPSVLHYMNSTDKTARGTSSGWYSAVAYNNCGLGSTPAAPNTECDEYPYYSSAEGGPGASLRQISADDNGRQGNQLQTFYSQCGLNGTGTSSEYIVVPDPFYDSIGFCTQ
jgi:hypothetical protein